MGRQILVDEREQRVEVRVDDATNDFERKAFGRRINGEHLPTFDVVFVTTELNELARLQLSAVEESHRAGEKHDISLLDAPVQEWLAGPRCLDHPAVVLQHCLKDPQTFA